MRRVRRSLLVLFAVFTTACTDEGPVSGPGTVTATVAGPNGPEGAALVVLLGEGIGEVSPIGTTELFVRRGVGSTQIVLINQDGGELSFEVAVADTTDLPAVVIQEVAGPDDELRELLDAYTLEFSR